MTHNDHQLTDAELDAYERGEAELEDLLGLTPQYMDGLRGRAQFFIDGGHQERALMMLEMLEELDRTDVQPTLLAVEVLLKMGDSDRAEEKINELLERRPDRGRQPPPLRRGH